jgi:hypothetical protein
MSRWCVFLFHRNAYANTSIPPPAYHARQTLQSRGCRVGGGGATRSPLPLPPGHVIRVGRGLLATNTLGLSPLETLAEAAAQVPNGIICLLSALAFHGMTTQAPVRSRRPGSRASIPSCCNSSSLLGRPTSKEWSDGALGTSSSASTDPPRRARTASNRAQDRPRHQAPVLAEVPETCPGPAELNRQSVRLRSSAGSQCWRHESPFGTLPDIVIRSGISVAVASRMT